MLKSTQTSKYETACFIQETYQDAEIDPRGFKLKRTIKGEPFIIFPATLQTFDITNRMGRRYSADNVMGCINSDERIARLESQNKWRGELNHPNPEKKGEQLSDIRMSIMEPTRCSHFINKHRLEGNRLRAEITTDPGTECGRQVTTETVDLHIQPSFSVRVFGGMIPNAGPNEPNIRVTKFITVDWVDFPSHQGADGDVKTTIIECANILFLKELAKYACEKSEEMVAVCESFQISPDEIVGINEGSIIIEQPTAKMRIPLMGEIRREVLSEIMKKGI
jgi:hypothetical protein